MLITRGFSNWTARFAVRVAAAVDWSVLAGYSELGPADRASAAHHELRTYLERLLTAPAGCAFEVRWLARPGRPLALFLLGRARGETEAQVHHAATAALRLVSAAPRHVVVEQLVDADAVTSACTPFPVHRDGLCDVRRPCVLAEPRRPDAGMRFYLAVPPYRPGPHPWPRLLGTLAASTEETMLSIGLEPVVAPHDLAPRLQSIAERYGELARPSTAPGGIFSGMSELPGERFAQWAAPLYQDAADRLRGTVFRLRITVASSAAFDLRAAETRALRLPHELAGMLAPLGTGNPCVVEAPADPAGRALAHETVGMLGVPSWGGHPVWRSPGVAPHLRLLTELADAAQAAATVWLPVPGGPAGFPVVEPAEADRVRPRQVNYHGPVSVDGDLVANKYLHGPFT